LERMIGNVVISKVRALKYVVLRKEKGSEREREREREIKTYRELLGTTKCVTL